MLRLACAQFAHTQLSLRHPRKSRGTWVPAFLAQWGPEQECPFQRSRHDGAKPVRLSLTENVRRDPSTYMKPAKG